ncbi:MFS transporter [Pseudochrobactrum sp. MP213Fo]|uniref:MFS transporter n=1 Tax=Pseudochrobactrum sp. MP213Fo TaxID=3022250 RepID=UPI003BA0C515
MPENITKLAGEQSLLHDDAEKELAAGQSGHQGATEPFSPPITEQQKDRAALGQHEKVVSAPQPQESTEDVSEHVPKETPAAPVTPLQPTKPFLLSAAFVCASLLMWITQGIGMNMVAVNIPQLQGGLGATTAETTWLLAAYMAPNVSLTLFLMKIRTQYGLRRFTEIGLLAFVFATSLHWFIHDLNSALIVRFFSGAAASPMSTLGFFYMLEAFPPSKKMSWGLCLALTCTTLGAPLARIISPHLLDLGLWQQLYMLEIGLAMLCFATVCTLKLTPIPHQKVLEKLDFISYPLIAVGFGLLAMMLVVGRIYWWFEAPWIGMCLAIAFGALAIAAAIEFNRENPLINIRWLTSRQTLTFAGMLLVFRVVLSEQTAGATGLFQALGVYNEQSTGLYWVLITASFAGGIVCAMVIRPGRETIIYSVALLLIICGAFMDGHANNLTRPEMMYLSQGMISFGGALFLPPAMAAGLMSALKNGPAYITSFIVVFIFTQSIGGLFGSAVFGSFVTWRQQFHLRGLYDQIVLSDPLVAQRIAQLAASTSKVLTDPVYVQAEGVALLAQQAVREATVLSYNDLFLLVAALAATALVVLIGRRLVLPAVVKLWQFGRSRPAALSQQPVN